MDEITESHEAALSDRRTRWTGVFIGVLAVSLAICAMGGDNAAKDANRANIDATNTWAFFQAKNIRRQAITLATDELELRLKVETSLPLDARAAIAAKLTDYRQQAGKLTTDPERRQGLDELFTQGKALEVERDAAMAKDPYFDWAEALLQIAIVIASVSIISRSMPLLAFAGMLGTAGGLLTLNGFLMLVRLPFLG